jgi:phosphoadenosine phosphosulfate reductase
VRDLSAGPTATEVLAQAVERHHPSLVLLCSFQKEESVLVGVLVPETLATWRAFEERFGVRVEVSDATGPWTGPDNCCGAAKVAALEAALAGADAWITGIRREQSPTRANAQPVEWDEKRSMWKYNPLVEWTDRDLWARIAERDLPYHPLHDQDYSSIGCAPCTQPGSGREGRWAGTDKTECGLHV